MSRCTGAYRGGFKVNTPRLEAPVLDYVNMLEEVFSDTVVDKELLPNITVSGNGLEGSCRVGGRSMETRTCIHMATTLVADKHPGKVSGYTFRCWFSFTAWGSTCPGEAQRHGNMEGLCREG